MAQHPILRAATDAKRRLLASEQTVARHITDAYANARARIAPHIARLTDAYGAELARVRQEAEDDAAKVPLTWLHTSGHLNRLQAVVRGEMTGFASHVEMYVTQGQMEAAQMGQGDATHLLLTALHPIAHLVSPAHLLRRPNADAVYALVGKLTHNGHPLRTWLASFGGDASAAIQQALYVGLALGRNPRAVASDLLGVLDMSRSRALNLCRTEMLGAYRSATSANFEANADVLDGWVWLADLSARTCGLCIAMNGTKHRLDETLDSHNSCRCTQAPITKSWQDILGPLGISASGIPETTISEQLGTDWFDQQDAATQAAILGKAGYNAYNSGALSLSDLVGHSDDGYYLKSLKQAGLDYQDYLGG